MATLERTGKYLARRRTPDGQRLVARAATAGEAEELVGSRLKAYLIPQSKPLGSSPTLHDCAVALWEPRIYQTSAATQKRYVACYAQHINPHLGSLPIREIRASDIQSWINKLTLKEVSRSGKAKDESKHPMAPKTILFTLGVLRQILNLCIDEGIIDRTPARRITTPKLPPKRQRVMDIKEARSLLKAIKGTSLHTPVLLAAVLGLRRSEAMDVKWSHLNRSTGTLLVAADGGKTEGSTRTLFLTPRLIKEIEAAGDQSSEYICSYRGEQLTRTTLDRMWRACKARPAGWTFHDLRHGAAGLLYAMTKDLEAVQSILGHTRIDMTMMYIGRSDKGKADAMSAVSDALFE